MRYTKKPVTIEAVRFDGIETVDDVPEPMFDGSFDPPAWVIDGLAKAESEEGAIWTGHRVNEPDVEGLFIHTLEGDHFATPGDWIIRGVKGELYPCKPDIFAATYDTEGAQAEGRIVGGVHMAERFDFGLAIHALRSGERVARAGWNGKGMFLFLVPGSRFSVNRPPLLGIYPEGTMIDYQPHIDMKTAQGTVVPWLASQGDVLADDWEIVEEAAL